MDASDPMFWRWVWLAAAVVFGLGEMAVAGSFFLAPFALGALVAAGLAFAGVAVGVEWIAFVVVSGVSFAALRPLVRRLDTSEAQPGVGASRQVGQRARVLEAIEGEHDHGMVLVGRERWRAESAHGEAFPVGSTVVVTEVRGTRVVVAPVDDPAGTLDPPGPSPEPPVGPPT